MMGTVGVDGVGARRVGRAVWGAGVELEGICFIKVDILYIYILRQNE